MLPPVAMLGLCEGLGRHAGLRISMQVKLFVELFTSKYQGLFFKLLRATKDEVEPLKGELAHNLEVSPLPELFA